MRNSTLLIFLLISSLSYAQPSDAVSLEDPEFDQSFASRVTPSITGKLLNLSETDRKKIKIKYSIVTLKGQVEKVADLANDGSFKILTDYPLPYQQIWFDIEDIFYAALYANKDLHVEIDIAKIKASGKELDFNGDGVKYLGSDGPLTTYMNEYTLFRRKDQLRLNAKLHAAPRSNTPTEATLTTELNNVFDSIKLIEDDYVKTHPSPYAWLLENERLSDYYSQILVAYWNHKMEPSLFKKVNAHKAYLVSNNGTGYYNYLSTYLMLQDTSRIRFTWQELSKLPDLTSVEKKAIDSIRLTENTHSTDSMYFKQQMRIWTPLNERTLRMTLASKINNNNRLVDSLFPAGKADIIKLLYQQSKDLKDEEVRLSLINPSMRTKWCKFIADMEVARTKAKLATIDRALSNTGKGVNTSFGKPLLQTSFGATMFKVENVSIQEFLAKLKKSFPGKAIVLDRWATWCGPCIGEMPHSKKLQLDSKDLPVMFVYACTLTGSDESKWKTKVAELELPGVHLLIDATLDAQLSEHFSFTGYPGYALIDKRGNYKPNAFKWISEVENRAALQALIE